MSNRARAARRVLILLLTVFTCAGLARRAQPMALQHRAASERSREVSQSSGRATTSFCSFKALAMYLFATIRPALAFNSLGVNAAIKGRLRSRSVQYPEPRHKDLFVNSESSLELEPSLKRPCHSRTNVPRMAQAVASRTPVVVYEQVTIPSPSEGPPAQEITVVDLMPYINSALEASSMRDGSVNLISRHTTTAITINEWESRLVRDIRAWLLKLAPPDDRSAVGSDAGIVYKHNDIDTRPESEDERQRCLENGWDVDDPEALQAWRDQEPINAHSHLASMLLGSSETIPVVDGKLVLGQWQSVMLVDLDGPRERTVGLQLIGFQ